MTTYAHVWTRDQPITCPCCGWTGGVIGNVDPGDMEAEIREGDFIQCDDCAAVFEVVPDGLKRCGA